MVLDFLWIILILSWFFGDGGRELCGCKISTPQLTAIQKVYNGAGDVVIRKGENKLCLYQKNSRRTLIVAGLVY